MKESSPKPLRIVLRQEQCTYENMERIGQITLQFDEKNGLTALVDGFEYTDLPTCREAVARALAWGGAVLSNMAESHRLIPGGMSQMHAIPEMLQHELDQAQPHMNKLRRDLSHRMFMLGETLPPIE